MGPFGTVKTAKLRPQDYIHPQVRALCFSYFYGTRDELLPVVFRVREAYKNACHAKPGPWQYFYGEVETVLKALCEGTFPEPSCLRLCPVSYFSVDWGDPPASQTTYPWGDDLTAFEYFQKLSSGHTLFSNTSDPTYTSELARASEAIGPATRHLGKFADPYSLEKEVRLFVYSPEFNPDFDIDRPDTLSHVCKISREGIVTSIDNA